MSFVEQRMMRFWLVGLSACMIPLVKAEATGILDIYSSKVDTTPTAPLTSFPTDPSPAEQWTIAISIGIFLAFMALAAFINYEKVAPMKGLPVLPSRIAADWGISAILAVFMAFIIGVLRWDYYEGPRIGYRFDFLSLLGVWLLCFWAVVAVRKIAMHALQDSQK